MAIITYPLNNINYSAEDAELFHCTRTSGVFAADEDFNATVTGTNNVVTIGQGIAWIRNSKFSGKVVANKAAVSVDMGLANGTYNRIDAIVLQFSASGNNTSIIRKQGTASTSPKAPSVTQTESVYELHLYHVYRRAGATSIVESDITDLRMNRDYCGVMSDDVTMLGDDFIRNDMIGVANGVASLNSSGKVPSNQLPSMNYIPTSQKGAANGVASLGSNGKVPSEQLPSALTMEMLTATISAGGTLDSQDVRLYTIGYLKLLAFRFTITTGSTTSSGLNFTLSKTVAPTNFSSGSGGAAFVGKQGTTGKYNPGNAWVYSKYLSIDKALPQNETSIVCGSIVIL